MVGILDQNSHAEMSVISLGVGTGVASSRFDTRDSPLVA